MRLSFNPKLRNYIRFYLGTLLLACLVTVRIWYYFTQNSIESCRNIELNTQELPVIGPYISKIHYKLSDSVYSFMPSPHAELVLGMVLGIDNFDQLPKFKDTLKRSGTVHVVVVSGFNISLVYASLIGILGSKYSGRNILIVIFCTLIYALLAGFNPPVVRAWVMSIFSGASAGIGQKFGTLRTLLLSVCLISAIFPCYILSLSFQLSSLATLGIIMISTPIQSNLERILKIKNFFVEDFSISLSAQIFVLPLILYVTKSVSLISLIINGLVLWTVPTITILGFVFSLSSFINTTLAKLIMLIIYPFTFIFTKSVEILSIPLLSTISVDITHIHLIVMYVILGLITLRLSYKDFNAS